MNAAFHNIRAIALVIAVLPLGSCTGSRMPVVGPTFSSDGAQIAYLWEESVHELAIGHGKTWFRTIYLRWCRADDPAAMSSVAIETLGLEFASSMTVDLDMKWSPDSSRVGVLTPYKLVIVETASRRKVEFRDGTITSFSWLSDNEVAYCAKRTREGMQRRVISRRKLDDAQPRKVATFDWYPVGEYTWKEYWAPSGRYVIFVDPAVGGRFHVVSVLDRTSRPFGQTNAYPIGVAWAPDSNQAFCVNNRVGPGYAYEAVVIKPVTGKMVDCTENFRDVFAENWPTLEPLWTADGRYVVVNALRISGHLVQPIPWKVIPLGQILAPNLTVPNKWSTINPSLSRLPVGGWVSVMPTGNLGDSPVLYAADYSGRRIIPMNAYPSSMSPDGTAVATVGADGQVKIHTLGKWWLSPAQPRRSTNTLRSPAMGH